MELGFNHTCIDFVGLSENGQMEGTFLLQPRRKLLKLLHLVNRFWILLVLDVNAYNVNRIISKHSETTTMKNVKCCGW